MTEARVHIERWSADPEWHVQLTATNAFVATALDFYIEPEQLQPFGCALTAFPRYQGDEASFELGSDLGRWAYHLYLRAYLFDSVGHSALEILTDNRASPPNHFSGAFRDSLRGRRTQQARQRYRGLARASR